MSSPSKPAGGYRCFAEPAVLVLALLLFAALAHYQWQHVADDAFIAFRYAHNLVAGKGPVWNPGEAVEGFSSPLWLGLLALGCPFAARLEIWAGVLGLFFHALALVLVHRLTLRLSRSSLAAAVACFAAAALYPPYHWATAGLETTLFAALVTAALLALVGDPPAWWPALAAAVGLARPEGPFLLVVFLGLMALVHGRAALTWPRLALALAPTLAWFLFRRTFYGDWLPNTYYAKATGDLASRLLLGVFYSFWAIVAWAATGAAARLAGGIERKVLAALVVLAAVLGVVVVEGGDWMWNGRFLVPALPGLCALAVSAIARAAGHRRVAGAVVCALALVPFLPSASLLGAALTWQRSPSASFQEGTLAEASHAVAAFIRQRYPAGALVAVNHAGAVPYGLPNPAIDMTGLCDWHIAHARQGGVHQKFDAAYVLSRKPDLVVLNTATRPGVGGLWYHPGYWEGETALVESPGWEDYRPVEVFWQWRWVADLPRYIVLYERRSSSHP